MKKKRKLIGTLSSLVLAIALMGFGVYAATSMTGKITSSVSFISKDIKCTFSVDVDGGKYLSGGVGANEQEYRHKTQSVNNESVNAAHTLDEFVMGHYTFDPTTEAGKKITYKVTITNDGNNAIQVKYIESKMFENIPDIMQVTKTNFQNVESIAVNGSYEGTVELLLLDASADIQVKDLDISFQVSKETSPTPANQFTYDTPSGGNIGIIGYKGTEKNIIIPKQDANGNKITSINLKNNTTIESVVFPNTITSVGISAFESCTSLKSIVLPSSVTSIGKSAFSNCSLLNNINIPNSVITLGESAFYRCTSLESVTIPGSVTTIGKQAFSTCSAITSLIIENGTQAGKTVIGDNAFEMCNSLVSVIIPGSVKEIGQVAFGYCNKLTDVTILSGVEKIGFYAFHQCVLLKNVEIQEGVTTIDEGAFKECSALVTITIPSSVTSLGTAIFYDSSSLTSVYFERTSTFSTLNSYLFYGIKNESTLYFKNQTVLDQFTEEHYDSSRTTKELY